MFRKLVPLHYWNCYQSRIFYTVIFRHCEFRYLTRCDIQWYVVIKVTAYMLLRLEECVPLRFGLLKAVRVFNAIKFEK